MGVGRREGTNEQDQPPALLFGQAFFEGRHGLAAFGDFVEELAVTFSAKALAVREIGRSGVVRGGVGAVAFAGVAMAGGAFFGIDGARGLQGGGGWLEGILALLGFFRDSPWTILEDHGDNRQDNDSEYQSEEGFARGESALREICHVCR